MFFIIIPILVIPKDLESWLHQSVLLVDVFYYILPVDQNSTTRIQQWKMRELKIHSLFVNYWCLQIENISYNIIENFTMNYLITTVLLVKVNQEYYLFSLTHMHKPQYIVHSYIIIQTNHWIVLWSFLLPLKRLLLFVSK